MVRRLSAVAAGFAVLTGVSLAHAQRPGTSFGDQGEFVISADRLFPLLGYTHASANQLTGVPPTASKISNTQDYSSLGFFWGGTDTLVTDTGGAIENPYTVPRVGFDYTILPNVTVGGDLLLYFTLGGSGSSETYLNNGSTQTTTVPAPKTTLFGIAPRGGYILHVSELLSVWLRGGLSYYTVTVHTTEPGNAGTDSNNFDQLSLDLDPQLVITPIPHVGFTIGATADIPLTGGHSLTHSQAGASSSASAFSSLFFIGATGGLLVWF